MNPGELERRAAFSRELVAVATRLGLPPEEVADSMLTMLVGIFRTHGIPLRALLQRVAYAWDQADAGAPRGSA